MDPVRDLKIIQDELRLKDIEKLDKRMKEMEKLVARGNDKKVSFC